jgi:2-polyprenyl-3-methyl-5-hydroxy-6-metoxy-1,4-benzoquinol methylase
MNKKPRTFYYILQDCKRVIKGCSPAIIHIDSESKLYADRIKGDLELISKQFLKRGRSLLDVGCSKGHLSGILSEFRYHAVGLDLPVRIKSPISPHLLTKRYSILGLNFVRTIVDDLKM